RGEHVASTCDQRASEIFIDEIFVRYLPAQDLSRRLAALETVTDLAVALPHLQSARHGIAVISLGVKTVDHSIFQFAGVGQYVARVEADDVVEVIDTMNVTVE